MKEKILLVAGFPPEGGGGGGVNLRSLISQIPDENIYWFSLQYDRTISSWFRPNMKRSNILFFLPGRKFRLINIFWKYFFSKIEFLFNLILCIKIYFIWKPSCFWFIIDQYSISTIFRFVKIFNIPYHLTVQDDPEVSMLLINEELSLDSKIKFEFLLRNSVTIDCTSHGMVKYYKNKFGVDSFMVSRSIDPNFIQSARKRKLFNDNCIKIVLGGWGNVSFPWPINLINSLNILEEMTGKNVYFYSFDPIFKSFESEKVIFCNKMIPSEFEKFLCQMDLGYAPDPLEDSLSVFALTSLSVKLLTYVSHSLPSLYHGPCNSSVSEMFSRHKAGEVVCSQVPQEIANGFFKLFISSESYRDNCLNLAAVDFNPAVLNQKILNRFN